MKSFKLFLLGVLLLCSSQLVLAQSKTVPAKPVNTSASAKSTTTQKAAVKAVLPQVEIAQQIAKGQSEFSLLGTYSIHAGVQKTIIGKCTLNSDGTYTVTVNSDENNHGNGIYEYKADTKTLVWKGGLFVSNAYSGALQKMNNGKLRIVLSKSTYAEKID